MCLNSSKKQSESSIASFTACVLPEVTDVFVSGNSNTGVSTSSVPLKTKSSWYALRTTYGREQKAYEYIVSHDGVAFLPTIKTVKVVEGKSETHTISRIPNIFFAYGTDVDIKKFVYDNVNLPFLRFYYKHTHVGSKILREPLKVPDKQIETLRIICNSEQEDVVLLPDEVKKFTLGEKVLVTKGAFQGVVGVVARFKGQQRVGIVIDGIMTIATAYVPNAFLERYMENKQ